jgi:hypothetical protein
VDFAYGPQHEAAKWVVEKCGPLGVRIYYATDADGRYGRLVIPTPELSFVLSVLRTTKYPRFARWIGDIAAKMIAGAPGPS